MTTNYTLSGRLQSRRYLIPLPVLIIAANTLQVETAEQDTVPKVRYNFTNIADISTVDKDTVIDVIGIISHVEDTTQITSKTTSKPYDKREITLVDNSNFSIRLTLWGATATQFTGALESVAAFKGVKVSDFGGRSLSLLASGSLALDPDVDESHKLKGWYDGAGKHDTFSTHQASMGGVGGTAGGRSQDYKTIAAIHDEQIGMQGDQAEYYTLRATVVFVKQESFAYPACQSEGCNKKVTEVQQDEWECAKCERSWPKPVYRYIASVNVSDHTGQMWLSCFDESARLLVGCSADELMELKEREDGGKSLGDKTLDATGRVWVFRCRAKMDTFNENTRYVWPEDLGFEGVVRRFASDGSWTAVAVLCCMLTKPQSTPPSLLRLRAGLAERVRQARGGHQAV